MNFILFFYNLALYQNFYKSLLRALQGCNSKKQPLFEKPVIISQTYFLRVFCFLHEIIITVDS